MISCQLHDFNAGFFCEARRVKEAAKERTSVRDWVVDKRNAASQKKTS